MRADPPASPCRVIARSRSRSSRATNSRTPAPISNTARSRISRTPIRATRTTTSCAGSIRRWRCRSGRSRAPLRGGAGLGRSARTSSADGRRGFASVQGGPPAECSGRTSHPRSSQFSDRLRHAHEAEARAGGSAETFRRRPAESLCEASTPNRRGRFGRAPRPRRSKHRVSRAARPTPRDRRSRDAGRGPRVWRAAPRDRRRNA